MIDPLVTIPPEALWESTVGFIAVFVSFVFAIGASSRTMAVGACGAYVAFVNYGVAVDDPLLSQVMYVSLVMVVIGIGFKIWKIEGPGGDGA
jgi:hypothetical protein